MEQKTGLHKQISSIFDGVPVPRNDKQTYSETVVQKAVSLFVGEEVEAPGNYPSSLSAPEPVSELAQNSAGAISSRKSVSNILSVETHLKSKHDSKKSSVFWSTLKSRLCAPVDSDIDTKQVIMTVLVGVVLTIFIIVFIH